MNDSKDDYVSMVVVLILNYLKTSNFNLRLSPNLAWLLPHLTDGHGKSHHIEIPFTFVIFTKVIGTYYEVGR